MDNVVLVERHVVEVASVDLGPDSVAVADVNAIPEPHT
jgi:hypothetical protein